MDTALNDHELIKVKYIAGKEEKRASTDALAAQTQSHVVGLIGNVAILYRQHPEEEKRKISLDA